VARQAGVTVPEPLWLCEDAGVLGKLVRDWHIVDSTTVKLPKALIAEYQGAGDYAALKIHKRFSVGVAPATTWSTARG